MERHNDPTEICDLEVEVSTISLGSPVAVGRTAEVYPWRHGQVVKLYHKWVKSGDVNREARIARLVHAAGAPTPAIGKVVRVNGRLGLIFERMNDLTMSKAMATSALSIPDAARLLVQLQADIHAINVGPKLIPQRGKLIKKILWARELSFLLRMKVLMTLRKLDDGTQLCHGDFHPSNILITERGAIAIDWIDATYGNPLADIARTLLVISPSRPGVKHSYDCQLFFEACLKQYSNLYADSLMQFAAWQPVIAAARLCEKPAERDWLLNTIKSSLG